MANNMNSFEDPAVKQRLLKSLMSGSKQRKLKQQSQQPAEEPENVYAVPEPQVNYQDVAPQETPTQYMDPNMAKQIQQWEDNYTPDEEEPVNPEENGQEETSED